MNAFLSTAKLCFKEKTYFGMGYLLGQYGLRLVSMMVLLMIWRVLFSQGADTGGLTLNQMLAYTVVSSALDPLLNVRTPASNWLHEGTILGLYQRPESIFSQLTAHTVGGWFIPLMAYGAPVLIAAALLGIDLRPATGWFYLSLPLTILQGFAVDYLYACLLVRAKGLTWTIHSVREALNVLLTGSLIPFALLPFGIGEWLALSPLGTLAGAPLSLLAGIESPARIIAAQVLWVVTLWPLAIYCFRKSRERMVSYGG